MEAPRSMIDGMKTLITGGAGFIGSTLADRLLAEGHHVAVIDSFVSGRRSNLAAAEASVGDRLQVHEIDIRDAGIEDIFTTFQPDVVFHLAAQMDVRVSVADPAYDADVNIMGSINVLESARKANVKKVLFASSGGTIYGADEARLPFDESAPQCPLSPYGITKAAFGDYLAAYKVMYDIDYAALALANVFGPRQDPHGEAGVVAIFGQRLLNGAPCKIFGDGSATRDYVFVDDVVEAFVRAWKQGSGLYNIGAGVETSTKQLYDAMAAAAGVTTEPEFLPARTGELQRSVLNAGKAQRELGWRASVDVPNGVVRVLDYFRENKR